MFARTRIMISVESRLVSHDDHNVTNDECPNQPAEYDCLFYVWIRGPKLINVNQARSCSRVRRRFYGIRFHGVISIGASTPIRFEQTNWRLRDLQIPTTRARAPSPRQQ